MAPPPEVFGHADGAAGAVMSDPKLPADELARRIEKLDFSTPDLTDLNTLDIIEDLVRRDWDDLNKDVLSQKGRT